MLRQWMFLFGMLVMSFSLYGAPADASKSISKESAEKWLSLVDSGKYWETWNQAAPGLHDLATAEEWENILKVSRDPMGSVKERKLIDQREAENPKWLPPGDYMILFYQSDFEHRSSVKELLTLVKENDGVWRVLTYQIE